MRWNLWLVVVVVSGLVGCGGAQPGASGGADSSADASSSGDSDGLKSYTAAELPEMDDSPLPAMDEGRVQIALPAGWKPLKRNPKFLIAAIPEDGSASKFPRITIAAGEPMIDEKSNITTNNAREIAEKLQAKMKKPPIEPCTPVALGDNVWVRHVRAAKSPDSTDVAIQALQTIKSGRLYTVELTVDAKENPRSSKVPIFYEKTLKAHRDYAYAVAANIKFPMEGGAAPAEDVKPAEIPAEPPADKPADEKPAEPAKSE